MSKIIVIGSYAPSLINFRGPLLSEMKNLGHEIITFAPEIDKKTSESLKTIGIKSRSIPLNRQGMNIIKDIILIFHLISLFKKEKPSIVLSYTIKPVIYGSIAAKIAGVKSINSIITGLGFTFINTSSKSKLLNILTRILYRMSLSFNEKIFFQNTDDLNLFYKQHIISNKKKSVVVNGSGVDLNYYSFDNQYPKHITFLLIARLIKSKGVLEYIEAAKIIKKKFPKIIFNLIGFYESSDGIKKEIISSANDNGIISFLGEAEDVRPHIKNCSVYVLPSYREGTPRTVLEAMAMGRPIISTDVPGCRETVVNGENGFLVESQNINSLVEAMVRFIEQPEIIPNMGLISRTFAQEKYDVNKVNCVILNSMNIKKNV